MAKSSNVSYDFYVMANGKWTHKGRYPGHMRDYVLKEAKENESKNDTPVKVVRDFYNEDAEAWEEVTVYVSGNAYPTAAGGAAAAAAPGGRQSIVSSALFGDSSSNANVTAPAELKQKTSSVLNQLTRLLIIIFASFVIAIAVTLFAMQFLQNSEYLSQRTLSLYSTYIAVGIFTFSFMLSAVPMLFWFIDSRVFKINFSFLSFRSGTSQQQRAATSSDTLIAQLATANSSAKKKAQRGRLSEGREREILAASVESIGVTEEELEENAAEEENAAREYEDLAATSPEEDEAAKPAKDPVEENRQLVMRFLKAIIGAFRAERHQLELHGHNKLGMQLVLSGALDFLMQHKALPVESRNQILVSMQKIIEVPFTLSTMFLAQYQEHQANPRHAKMIETGFAEMRRFADDPEYIPAPVVAAFDSWEKNVQSRVSGILSNKSTLSGETPEQTPAVVLAEVSPLPPANGTPPLSEDELELIQEERDILTHNIMQQFYGQDIRDGGHSVTATFPDANSAAQASIALLNAVSFQSHSSPEHALQARVGIFSSESEIAREAAEKEAWTICGEAAYGQILCNDFVSGLISQKDKVSRQENGGSRYVISWEN